MMEQIKNFILNLQELPEQKRTSIFFAIMTIVAVLMGIIALVTARNDISKIGSSIEDINLPLNNQYIERESQFPQSPEETPSGSIDSNYEFQEEERGFDTTIEPNL